MKYLLLIFTVVILSGCSGKRLYWGYPPVESSDTLTIIDTVEIDVPVYFEMPKDTVRLVDTIYIESSLEAFIDTLKTEYAQSHCGWVEGIMLHELFHRDAIIRDTVTVYLPSETKYIVTEKINQVPVTPWWHKWVLFVLILVIGLLVLRR